MDSQIFACLSTSVVIFLTNEALSLRKTYTLITDRSHRHKRDDTVSVPASGISIDQFKQEKIIRTECVKKFHSSSNLNFLTDIFFKSTLFFKSKLGII